MAALKLDRTDKRILALMQANGRISNLELAEKVGLSPTPCSRRVKQLEDSGLIERHVTLLNQARLGLNITAMISITMDRHTPERFATFERAVSEFPEVIECSIVTGQAADYLLKVKGMLVNPGVVVQALDAILGATPYLVSVVQSAPGQGLSSDVMALQVEAEAADALKASLIQCVKQACGVTPELQFVGPQTLMAQGASWKARKFVDLRSH